MATDPFNHTTADEHSISYEGLVKREEVDGKSIVYLPSEPFMQGHTFAVDMSVPDSDSTLTGPFQIEYVLGTEFAIFQNKMPAVSFEDGYSYLVMGPRLEDARLTLKCVDTNSGAQKEIIFSVQGSKGMVQKLIIETPEVDLSTAIRQTNRLVADFIDTVSFSKCVPISVRHIEVHTVDKKSLRRYATIPYAPRPLTVDDFKKILIVPPRLKAALRLFREGVNASKLHYRLLCFYRVWEVVRKVRTENNQDIFASAMKPDRPRRVLPANELTKCYFPAYVGKSVNEFLDYTYSTSRNDLAHGNLDAYFELVLDPAIVRIDHQIDATNAVLMSVLPDMIQDEMDLMARHGLRGSRLVSEGNAETVSDHGG